MQIDRRSFVGTSLAALLVGAPSLAEARFIRGAGTSFNGGRSEVNMNFIANSNEYAFINVFRNTDNPWIQVGGGVLPPSQQNSDGYATDLTGTGGGVLKLINVPTSLEKPGDWILSWTGSGATMAVAMPNGTVTTVSGNATTSPWRFTPTADNSDYNTITVTISALGTGVSNLQLYHVNDAADLAAGKIYTQKFKDKLIEANFGVIRFLNWQECNTTLCTSWATRKLFTALTWGQRDYRPEFYAGTSSNTLADYSVTVPGTLKHSSDGTTWTNGDAPKDKDTVIVLFGAGITTGAMTLKVGTGGTSSVISVVNPSHTALSSGGADYPIATRYATFVYDSSVVRWIKTGGDGNLNNTGIINGMPIEALLQLCIEVGAHPWFHIPPYSCDPMQDFLPQLALYVKNNKPSWMIPRFEVSNELWNPSFYSEFYATAKATAAGWASPNYMQWYGKAIVSCGQVLNAILGAGNYHLSCAVQTGTGNTLGSCQNSDERMTAASYFGQAAAAQSALTGAWGTVNFSKDHAYNYATHVTCANYFNPINFAHGTQPPLLTSMVSSVGGVRFPIVSCAGGTMVVTTANIDTPGGAITAGMTLAGLKIPAGTTITNVTGTTTLTLTLSQSFTLPANWHVYAYLTSGASALQDYVDSVSLGVVFNASTSGNLLTVHSTTGGASGINSIQIGQELSWTGSYANSYITGNNSTDGTLTGTGGVGTYRLDAAPGSGAITTTNVTAFWIFSNVNMQIFLTNWKAWAQGFGIQKMNFYEGGYSPDYVNVTTPPYSDALTILKYLGKFVSSTSRRVGGIGGYNTDNYNICASMTGGGFAASFPSQYLLTGPYPSIQVWNMLETIYQTNTPIFDSIVTYNH